MNMFQTIHNHDHGMLSHPGDSVGWKEGPHHMIMSKQVSRYSDMQVKWLYVYEGLRDIIRHNVLVDFGGVV